MCGPFRAPSRCAHVPTLRKCTHGCDDKINTADLCGVSGGHCTPSRPPSPPALSVCAAESEGEECTGSFGPAGRRGGAVI